MMKNYLLLILFATTFTTLYAQLPDDCEGDRYKKTIYQEEDLSQVTYTFGKNVNPAGDSVELEMIVVHNPEDDAFEKPAIILAFGGGFVQGDKESMLDAAEEYAMRGFVVSVIDYRLWDASRLGFPSAYNLKTTAVMAVSDMKASIKMIRYLAENNPELNIDEDRVLIGGVSAGAITALHTAYVDESDLNGEIGDLINANGGIEGNSYLSFTEKYSTEVNGVVNYSGGLFDTLILDAGEPPLVSIHGDIDETVPYGEGKAVGIVHMFGSSTVHKRAIDVGVNSLFLGVEGGGHTDIYFLPQFQSARDSLGKLEIELFEQIFCYVTDIAELNHSDLQIKLFPNPVSDQLEIVSEFPIGAYQIINMQGRIIDEGSYNRQNVCTLDVEDLDRGVYILNLQYEESGSAKATSRKFVKK